MNDKTKIRKLQKEIRRLKEELKKSEDAYEFMWKMRIQDEKERKFLRGFAVISNPNQTKSDNA